MTVCDEAYI